MKKFCESLREYIIEIKKLKKKINKVTVRINRLNKVC